MRYKVVLPLAAAAIPALLFAFSDGPPVRRSGVPADGGQTCAACHRIEALGDANSDPRGSLTIQTSDYRPGRPQIIRVTVRHPEGARWGFQLTARRASDPSRMAGTFTESDRVLVRCDDGTLRGAPPPCAPGQLEFASHTRPSTSAGTSGGNSWEVEWTPPADNVGDVIFYAAGNAANSSNSNVGDRIYTATATVANDAGCTLTERPLVRGVGNAAGPQTAIAMNTLISIYGMNFQTPGIRREAGRADYRDGKYPAELSCVAVEVAGVRAPVLYVDSGQINVQVPTLTQLGTVPVRVILNPDRPNQMISEVVNITLQPYAPAFFTFNGSSIAALHPDFSVAAEPSVRPGGRPVRPGDVVLLYLTGLGPTEPVYQAGEIPPGRVPLRDRITVMIGGRTLEASDIQYAGSAPGFLSGVYQLNVRVPASTSPGNVPVIVTIGGVTSPAAATIPVAGPQ